MSNSYSFDVDGTLRFEGRIIEPYDGDIKTDFDWLRFAAVAAIAQARRFGFDEGAAQYRVELRDKFAMAALGSFDLSATETYEYKQVAIDAFAIADAMLAERVKGGAK